MGQWALQSNKTDAEFAAPTTEIVKFSRPLSDIEAGSVLCSIPPAGMSLQSRLSAPLRSTSDAGKRHPRFR
jgi:hypothetical protein